ncbi:MAG: hypothetical protein ABIY55_00565 [Kofleriaceae bacterium]
MTRETKSDQVVERKPGPTGAPDLDAEHDPGVARQASRAGLRREHDKAKDASHDAVDHELALAAVQIEHATAQVQERIDIFKFTDKVGAVGAGSNADECKQYLALVAARLRHVIADAAPHREGTNALKPSIRRVSRAFAAFEATWNTALTTFATQRLGERTGLAPRDLIVELNRAFGMSYDEQHGPEAGEDLGSDAKILEQAIHSNLVAARATARAVRMGLGAGDAKLVASDLHQMVHHLNEVSATIRTEVGSHDNAKAYDHALLQQTLTEVHAVQHELAVAPALAGELAGNSTFQFSLLTLERRTGVKRTTTAGGEVHDIKTRVVSKRAEGGAVVLGLGSGADQGITENMTGYLVDAQGSRGQRFQAGAVTPETCEVTLNIALDYILTYPNALLNPAKP